MSRSIPVFRPILLGLPLAVVLLGTDAAPGQSGLSGELRERVPARESGHPTSERRVALPGAADEFGIPFTQGDPIPIPSWPSAIATADFDRDGRVDVAAAIPDSHRISVWSPARGELIGEIAASSPLRLAAGRFVRSPAADLVVLSSGNPGMVTLFQGLGDGRFKALASIPVGAHPTDMAVADLDGDRRLDLVVSCDGDSSLYVLRGGGHGFRTPRRTPGIPHPSSVSIADENHDGSPDVQVSLYSDSTVRLLRNAGDGTWASQRDVRCGYLPGGVRLADLDNDGSLDLATVHAGLRAEVRRGDGAGGFGPRLLWPLIGSDQSLPVMDCADLDGDGALELLVGHGSYWNVAWVWILSVTPGGLVERVRYYVAPGINTYTTAFVTALHVADLDGDGGRDVLVGRIHDEPRGAQAPMLALRQLRGIALAGLQEYDFVPFVPGPIAVDAVDPGLRGRDDLLVSRGGRTALARFTDDGLVESMLEFPGGLHDAVRDLNGDGRADLVTTRADSTMLTRWNAAGGLEPTEVVHEGRLLSFGDFDGDGDPDLVVRDAAGRLRTCWNDGAGHFAGCASDDDVAPSLLAAAGDLDADGVDDLAIVAGFDGVGDSVMVHRGVGAGGFQLMTSFVLPRETPYDLYDPVPQQIFLRDLDNDGRDDILVLMSAPYDGGVVHVRLSRSDWEFEPRPAAFVLREEARIFPLDVDSDGDLDLAATMHSGNGDGRLQYLLNDGTGALANPKPGVHPLNAYPRALTFGRFGADDMPDLVVGYPGYRGFGFGLMLNRGTGAVTAVSNSSTRAANGRPVPPGFGLEAAIPNPSFGAPILRYRIVAGEPATLSLHDVAGRRVRRVMLPAGAGGFGIADLREAGALEPGLYWARLEQGARAAVVRVVVVR